MWSILNMTVKSLVAVVVPRTGIQTSLKMVSEEKTCYKMVY